jgi:hypothetical protein
MRSIVTSTLALALVLAPAAVFAQTTTTAAQSPATPVAPKLSFSTPAGLLLVQVKQDQTAVFEELMSKIKSGLAASDISGLKDEAAGLKLYKSSEGMNGNALYVIVADPAVPGGEYSFLDALAKTLTPELQRDPATTEMYKKYFASYTADGKVLGFNKLNLTPIAGIR